MTETPFKLRYTSEIVGTFVLVSVLLLVTGIFLAGRAQGWFERKAVLHTTFGTDKGAFGLREGDEVLIRDTVAGSIGKIVPMPDGTLRTTFKMKYQFLSHLKSDSVAKVRRKFGFAGDSVVDIQPGKAGTPLKDGDFIECQKEEELMDTAKQAMKDLQDVVMPILKEFRDVLSNVNKVTTDDIRNGGGLLSTVLKDQKLAEDFRRAVGNMNSLLVGTQDAVGETRKLIKGIQKHWLWRRYMDKDREPELLLQAGFISPDVDPDTRHFKSELESARAANDPEMIARNAYNLAVCSLEQGKPGEALPLVREARDELTTAGKDILCTYILEAQVLQRAGKVAEALAAAKTAENMIKRSTDRAVELQSRVVMALLLMEGGDVQAARASVKRIESLSDKVESPVVKSMAAGFLGDLLTAENRPADAATRYDTEAGLLKTAGLYEQMAQALKKAGRAYVAAGNNGAAADRYFRAGRSFFSNGIVDPATDSLKKAAEIAKMAGDQAVIARISAFQQEMETAKASTE